jgi:anti-anti-sigma regulatory factor
MMREAARLEASAFARGSLLSIQGRLDVGAARRLLDIAQGALSASPAALVIDLTAATSLDAFGRAALRRVIRRAGRRGTVVYLVANPGMQHELGDVSSATARSRVVSKRRIALAAAIAASAH